MVKNVLVIETEGQKRVTSVMDIPALSESMEKPKKSDEAVLQCYRAYNKAIEPGSSLMTTNE